MVNVNVDLRWNACRFIMRFVLNELSDSVGAHSSHRNESLYSEQGIISLEIPQYL